MSDAFSSVSLSQLSNIHGGQHSPVIPPPGLVQGAGQVLKKAVPVLKVIDAADGAITDYDKARAAGDGRLSSVGSGGLGALNRATFGLSNWVIGR